MPSVFLLNISFAPKFFCIILIITLNINIFPFANYTVENACFHGVLYIWIKSKMPVAFGTQFKKREKQIFASTLYMHVSVCVCFSSLKHRIYLSVIIHIISM